MGTWVFKWVGCQLFSVLLFEFEPHFRGLSSDCVMVELYFFFSRFVTPRSICSGELNWIDSCHISTEAKTCKHLFLECPSFTQIFHKLQHINKYSSPNFVIIMNQFVHQPTVCNTFATIFWLIWKARNSYIFKNQPINQFLIWAQTGFANYC